MDLGDFQNEFDSINDRTYLKQINPVLNSESFITEANKIYDIAINRLHEPFFKLNKPKLRIIYKNMMLYFRGDNRSLYDLKKGIFVHGGTGCGKSLVFEIFKEYTNDLRVNSFVKTKQLKIVADVSKNGIDALDKYVKERQPVILYIDDFGSGNSIINYYGTNYDVMDELIQSRYDEYVKSGAITHISTNIKPADFKHKFNERITSRLNTMFNIIKFPDIDYRRVKL